MVTQQLCVCILTGSGHGSQTQDWQGEEEDGYNETLCPCDFKQVLMNAQVLWCAALRCCITSELSMQSLQAEYLLPLQSADANHCSFCNGLQQCIVVMADAKPACHAADLLIPQGICLVELVNSKTPAWDQARCRLQHRCGLNMILLMSACSFPSCRPVSDTAPVVMPAKPTPALHSC